MTATSRLLISKAGWPSHIRSRRRQPSDIFAAGGVTATRRSYGVVGLSSVGDDDFRLEMRWRFHGVRDKTVLFGLFEDDVRFLAVLLLRNSEPRHHLEARKLVELVDLVEF